MKSFKFELGDSVRITISGEAGEVIGRAEFAGGQNSYQLRWRNALGCAMESWWNEDALTAAS